MKRNPDGKYLFVLLFCLLAAVAIAVRFPIYGRRNTGAAYHAFDDSRKHAALYVDMEAEIRELAPVPDVIPWFEHWYGVSGSNHLRLCRKWDCTPFITWEPNHVSLIEIAEGKHDRYIRHFFRRISRISPDRDVLVRFAHEMELKPLYGTGWYTWQLDDGAYYIAAWRHVVDLGREYCPNIKWVWSPNRVDGAEAAYYPGADYVDYIGITMNHNGDRMIRYRTLQDFYENEGRRDHLLAYGKKVIISETGYSLDAEEDPAVKETFLRSVFDCLQEDPEITLACFFNEDKSLVKRYGVSDNDTYMRIFYEGLERVGSKKTVQ